MSRPLVVLLTDFGLKDPFVGMMKGVILSTARGDVRFLDLTHEVPPQDIRTGAFFLRAAEKYLPEGALVVAVVDPGVGSARHVLYARTKRRSFLAPDNGLLSWIGEPFQEVRRLQRLPLPLGEGRVRATQPVGGTFHGRDVFAPAAAALLSGTRPGALGPRTDQMARLPAPRFERMAGVVRGEVVARDRFGNCWTSLPSADLPPGGSVTFRGRKLGSVRHHYADVRPGRPLAVAGSFGVVELAVRNGDFARRFKAVPGDEVSCHV